MKKQKQLRDYNEYAGKKTAKIKVRNDKPLKYALIFACSLAMLICMMLPFSKVYVYEGEPDQLGILDGKAIDFPLNTYRILRWAAGSLGGSDETPPDGLNLGNIIEWIDNEGIEKLIFGNNSTVNKLMPQIITIVVIGAVLIILQLVQFVLSIFGMLGANKLEYYLNIITLATAAISLGWLIFTVFFGIHGKLLFGVANFSIIFSYGTPLILVLAIGSAVSAFLVKK